jgi:hypothetical protein
MQTLSFQQNNRASSDSMTFQFHQDEAAVQHVDHRALCSAVRAWAAAEGRMVVALEIKEAAEEMELSGIDMAVNADVWNVKLFRWLDNKEDVAGLPGERRSSWRRQSSQFCRWSIAVAWLKTTTSLCVSPDR